MSRFKAFAIHFGISSLIFLCLAGVILTWWHPGIFFDIDGGWEGIRIIAVVDPVLGPCLTLIVYRHGKPGLKMDLTLIGLFQAACLSAGIWVVHNERPLAMVMVDDTSFSMSAKDYLSVGIEPPNLSRFSDRGIAGFASMGEAFLDFMSELRPADSNPYLDQDSLLAERWSLPQSSAHPPQ